MAARANTLLEVMTTTIGRAMRADARSRDHGLPKDQRDFHAGRREAYLQVIALINGSEVKSIRAGVLGTGNRQARELSFLGTDDD